MPDFDYINWKIGSLLKSVLDVALFIKKSDLWMHLIILFMFANQ